MAFSVLPKCANLRIDIFLNKGYCDSSIPPTITHNAGTRGVTYIVPYQQHWCLSTKFPLIN